NDGELVIVGPFANMSGGTIENNELMEISGPLENYGTIDNADEIDLTHPLANYGAIRGAGALHDIDLVMVHNFVNSFDLNGLAGTAPADMRVLAASFDAGAVTLPP